jgi:glycosyltransferase involved in cell wall biosynthesis
MAKFRNLVSVVIPCYNAERWVGEAVTSCLQQTYQPIEVIVVDDGSTDGSAAILQSFGERICVESGPHRGGSCARNCGFLLSKGEYIQFLDADDYLLPEKIERQVIFLEETGADVIYSDWRHQYHQSDGAVVVGEIQISGVQNDVLESLLRGWWTAPVSLLVRRDIVIQCGGWDNQLAAGQDRDFFISVAMNGADIRYQPGCFSVYRRYGNVTVSTSNRPRWLENHQRVLEKAESRLVAAGRLSERYEQALAQSYFSIARNYYDIDRLKYKQMLKKTLSLHPGFRPNDSTFYRIIQQMFGFEIADKLASYKRRVLGYVQ